MLCSLDRGLPARWWVALLSLSIFVCVPAGAKLMADEAVQQVAPARSSTPLIVVGFVGGFVRRDDQRHSAVQLAEKLRAEHPNHLRIAIFGNWHRKAAHQAILRWLDTDEDGRLSEAEKKNARIVLFGHSWGGSGLISLARQLQREGIPILLTVQVDSIAKPGQNDRLIPANVAEAANFYQTHGLLRGRRRITAADSDHTKILGNFLFDAAETPAECNQYPWLTRHLFRGHTAIECAPQVWSEVEGLIGSYTSAEQATSWAQLR